MVTLETAEKALKQVYLGVVADQLNIGTNPLMAKISQTSSDVWGKEIVKLAPYGINGGIGAGTESGNLPTPSANNYDRFKLELKNLYGTIEISDKAIRASESNSGAFVNLLNAEMEGLLKASKFNLSRMMYGDGSGKIATVSAVCTPSSIAVESVRNLMEGMLIDIYAKAGTIYSGLAGVKIISIDRVANKITVATTSVQSLAIGDFITVQGSLNNEITGLGAIFGTSDLYGLPRAGRSWLAPKNIEKVGLISSLVMQEAIDTVEEVAGSSINYITCSYDVRRAYLDHLAISRMNIDFLTLDGGFKAISYNGMPLVADRFIEKGTMYMLNTDDFKLHQLCDWRWLEGEGGRVIKQKPNSPTYTATLVKYADMICDKPIGQIKLSGIGA